jgi:hypothetical protein
VACNLQVGPSLVPNPFTSCFRIFSQLFPTHCRLIPTLCTSLNNSEMAPSLSCTKPHQQPSPLVLFHFLVGWKLRRFPLEARAEVTCLRSVQSAGSCSSSKQPKHSKKKSRSRSSSRKRSRQLPAVAAAVQVAFLQVPPAALACPSLLSKQQQGGCQAAVRCVCVCV